MVDSESLSLGFGGLSAMLDRAATRYLVAFFDQMFRPDRAASIRAASSPGSSPTQRQNGDVLTADGRRRSGGIRPRTGTPRLLGQKIEQPFLFT